MHQSIETPDPRNIPGDIEDLTPLNNAMALKRGQQRGFNMREYLKKVTFQIELVCKS